jgi:glycine cleavage system H protein
MHGNKPGHHATVAVVALRRALHMAHKSCLTNRLLPDSMHLMSNVPADLKYAKSHEWVRASGDTATVGITDHAQHELTDIVFVELPDVGRKVKAGEACAVVESVKTASDIYSPVSGEIVEVNKTVVDNPGLVNTAPHGDGWFFKLKLANASELNSLLTPEQYSAQIKAH